VIKPSGMLDPDDAPDWLSELFDARLNAAVVAGVDQDDCGVVEVGDGRLLVASTDFLNAHPIALELGIGTQRDLGRLLVAANLSDLCGSGAHPIALLVGAQMRKDSRTDDFRELMAGVDHEARKWGVPVIGGDTKLGPATSMFAVAIGTASSPDQLFLRRAGSPGDSLWVSGAIGGCCAAVLGLTNATQWDLSASWQAWARTAILEPRLPLTMSRALSSIGGSRAGTDLSDGLGANLSSLCKASKCGAVVHCTDIPVATEVATLGRVLDTPAFYFAFPTGGDFQFVVTARATESEVMAELGLTRIGELTEEPALVVELPDGRLAPMMITGHRDSRNLSFANEIAHLLTVMREGR
jgi:thiamine-monophosphate kinase